jgi:uncharacterized protein YceK
VKSAYIQYALTRAWQARLCAEGACGLVCQDPGLLGLLRQTVRRHRSRNQRRRGLCRPQAVQDCAVSPQCQLWVHTVSGRGCKLVTWSWQYAQAVCVHYALCTLCSKRHLHCATTYTVRLHRAATLSNVQEAESVFKRRPFAGGCEQGRKALQDDSLYSKRIEIWWEIDQKWCECRMPVIALPFSVQGSPSPLVATLLLPSAIAVTCADPCACECCMGMCI